MPTTFLGSPPTSSITTASLESDAPLPVEHLLLALAVGDNDALTIRILDTGGNKRHRVPNQVGEGVPQFLVRRDRLIRPDQLRRDVLVGHPGCYRRPQLRCPPMLIAAVCAVTEDRFEEDI